MGFRLVPCGGMTRVQCRLVASLMLALLVPYVECTSVLYPLDDSETVIYCPDDVNTFQINLTNPVQLFGNNIDMMFMSSGGYLTGNYRPNLEEPGKFPFYTDTNHTVDCDDHDLCWADYYYADARVDELQAENYTGECVNGMNLTETYEVYSSFVYDYIANYSRTLSPDGCIPSNVDDSSEPSYDWMVAAYWQNLDGQFFDALMWFRETSNASILAQAKADVEALDSVTSFTPTQAILFTWDGVTYIDGFAWGNPQLDFQVVMVTDGTDMYGIFNYETLSFSAGQAGFDAGDTSNYCGLYYSRSNFSTMWTQTSNVGVAGRWVMQLGKGYDTTICEPLRAELPYCICDDGWEGVLCASSVDDCASHTCPEEAACVDGHLTYTCDYCVNVTCENEGTCTSNGTAYQCECVGNHTGVHCEECLQLSCENGGVCTNNATTGENTCACGSGYSGTMCETSNANAQVDADESQTINGLSGGEIAGITVGAIAAAAILGAGIYFIASRLKKKGDKVEPEAPEPRNVTTASHA